MRSTRQKVPVAGEGGEMMAAILAVLLCLWLPNTGLLAQEPPHINRGYATDGRDATIIRFQTAPGFVDVSSTDLIPWRDFDFWEAPAGVQSKILSREEKTG